MKVSEKWDAIEVVVQDGDMRLEQRETAISAMEDLRELMESQWLTLQMLEWRTDERRVPGVRYCPICGMPEHHGHMGNCRLKAMLIR